MGLLSIITKLVTVLAVCIGLALFSVKIPDNMTNATEARIGTRFNEITILLGDLAAMLGFEKISTMRSISQYTEITLNKKKQNPDIKLEVIKMAGVPVHVYTPKDRKPGGPVIIYIHGGGFIWLSPEHYHSAVQNMAARTNFLILSVDYRLAPEHPFPAAIDDCIKVTQHVMDNAKSLQIDPKRVAVMGDSAGGNLAVAVALAMRDKNPQKMPKIQVPIYPVLQYLDFNTPSYQNDTEVLLAKSHMPMYVLGYALGMKPEAIDRKTRDLFRKNLFASTEVWKKHFHKFSHNGLRHKQVRAKYTPSSIPENNEGFSKEFNKIIQNPLYAPLMSDDLSGLPETLLLSCEYDILRDDSFWYAQRLREVKVKVTHMHDEACFHGAMTVIDDQETFLKGVDYLRQNL